MKKIVAVVVLLLFVAAPRDGRGHDYLESEERGRDLEP